MLQVVPDFMMKKVVLFEVNHRLHTVSGVSTDFPTDTLVSIAALALPTLINTSPVLGIKLGMAHLATNAQLLAETGLGVLARGAAWMPKQGGQDEKDEHNPVIASTYCPPPVRRRSGPR